MRVTYSPTSTSKEPTSKADSKVTSFDFSPLNRIVFGPGCSDQVGALARELGGSRVLLVSDPGLKKAGHTELVFSSLKKSGIEVFLFDDVEENPEEFHVAKGKDFAQLNNINFIVALGGGSSMDCAKGINFLLTNGGKMSDYKGIGLAKKPMLPSIGIPTTSGTGSEAQSFALITDSSTHLKMACGDKKAAFKVCLLDPELTISQPHMVTAATGIDAISHALESYVSTKKNTVSQTFARQAWGMLVENLPIVLKNPSDINARGAMQLGAHFAGISIENSMLGICHSCANPLTAHYGIPHGIAIGILLPHVLRFNSHHVGNCYNTLVTDIGKNTDGIGESGDILANIITGFLALAGIPKNLHDCGVSHGILEVLAEEASEQWTAKFNPRLVLEKDLLEIYQLAMG
ncbi:MAG: iron-containing alcohol dehydrogenase [Planctomycetes bacterium]|nr:iron-containing alcohol dehydrogenase [Planctomycetota bacterium]NBY02829.1 iron-containing alcohol dehydrogenase [Planctomycetota bacterium]